MARRAARHRLARAADLDLDARGGEDLLHELRLGALGHDAAAIDDHHPIADHGDLRKDVGREDDGVLAGQGPDEGADLGDLLGVETDGGLVQDQHLGVAQQRLGQAHALAIALGQLADEAALHVGDEAPGHDVGHPPLALPPRHALDLGHELEV